LLLVLFQKLRLLSFPVFAEEKHAKQPHMFPERYPNALAGLLLNQLPKLERYNTTRRNIASYYGSELRSNKNVQLLSYPDDAIYLRFPILVLHPGELLRRAKREGILLGNWYHNIIDPAGVDFGVISFNPESCPNASRTASMIVNLPTNIAKSEAARVVRLFRT
jgi:dTDP-4-amino-4,6-dideoxygalactose transaminase